MKPILRSIAALSGVALAVATLGACATGSEGESSMPAPTESTPLKVVWLSVTDFLLPHIAEDNGFFEDEGVDVELVEFFGSTNVQLPMVVKREYDLGIGGTANLLPAIMQGLDVSLIAGIGTVQATDLETSSNNLIYADPSITRPRDLEGRTVAFQSIGGQQQMLVSIVVAEDGGDPNLIDFVQMPVQNIPAAIESGQIDAGQGYEPYLSLARSMNLKELFAIGEGAPGAPGVTYFASNSLLDDRGDDVDAFVRAMARAAELVMADKELMRSVVQEYTETPEDLLAGIQAFGNFSTDITEQSYLDYANLSFEWKLIPNVLEPASDWVYTPGS